MTEWLRSAKNVEDGARRNDGNIAVLTECQQIAVSRDDEICVS